MNKIFELKGSSLNLHTLFLYTPEMQEIENKIKNLVSSAPLMFNNTPIILDCCYLNENIPDQMLNSLRSLFKTNGMSLIGIRNASPEDIDQAQHLKIPIINTASTPKSNKSSPKKPPPNNNKIHPNHLRSGQQLSNTQGDITILGNVNPGAEVISSGNITIIGALRGKALAGIQGNNQATIYCRECYGELVAINGIHQTIEKISRDYIGKSIIWRLKQNKLEAKILKLI
ncbi:MAG TPA: septum site-determining protein MinC [Gammaproteobacteria bacterium]|nr:septum site-determining protein MinC [Gammaproteobacteria bacterium]